MPLARIISSSHACSRELAIDLLARGYTVEIVSPDRIPDNLADLELRVDAGPGDQLIASVEAHNGARSASLDFVHHLRAPMMDFIRRPLPSEPIQSAINSNTERRATENKTLEERLQSASQSAPHPVKILPHPPVKILPDPEPPVRLMGKERAPSVQPQRTLPEKARPTPVAAKSRFVKASKVFRPLFVPAKALSKMHPKASDWRAALVLIGILLLALSMWIGMRHADKAVAAASAIAPSQPPTQALAAVPANSSSVPVTAGVSIDPASSNHPTNPSPANAAVSITKFRLIARQRISPKDDGNYVARDTVVYFDKRTAEEATARGGQARRSNKRHAAASNSHSGVIAANSVTYFDNKPTPKPLKQDAGIKSDSNQN
jgi:hypothetical protein